MFLKNETMLLFVKFLWAGLILGVVAIILKNICKIFKKNVVLVNVLEFVFWLSFGIIYELLCKNYTNFAFFGAGLVGMILGIIIIKISIDFFFDYFVRFIYNEITLKKDELKMENYKQAKKFENIVRLSVLFFVAVLVVAIVSFVKLGKARQKNEQYDNLLAELKLEKENLSKSVDDKNYDYYETQVRNKLGMVDGDETYIEYK